MMPKSLMIRGPPDKQNHSKSGRSERERVLPQGPTGGFFVLFEPVAGHAMQTICPVLRRLSGQVDRTGGEAKDRQSDQGTF